MQECLVPSSYGDIKVPVYWKGDRFAVTQNIRGSGYVVTHVKTGCKVGEGYKEQWKAELVAQKLDVEPILKALNIYSYGQQVIDPHPAVAPLMPRIRSVTQRILDEVSALKEKD